MLFRSSRPAIFLDYASGTPLDPLIFRVMKPYFTDEWYNPSSIYQKGKEMQDLLLSLRKDVAACMQVNYTEIYFADGATAGNNIYISGVIRAWQQDHPGRTAHLIVSAIEHSSILEQARALAETDVRVDFLSVDEDGRVDLHELKELITEDTVVVSVGYVNGEIGVVQDMKALGKIIRQYRKYNDTEYPYFHTDAVQAVNFFPITIPQLGCDAMTINGGKIYGPKKSAVVYMKKDTKHRALLFGGAQESGLFPGTENMPYIVGMTKALEKARALQDTERERLTALRNWFCDEIREQFPEAHINGAGASCAPHIVNLSFPSLSSEELVLRLDAKGVMVSEKSACRSDEEGDSPVIRALRDTNTQSIRFSFGRATKKSELKRTLKILHACIKRMQSR